MPSSTYSEEQPSKPEECEDVAKALEEAALALELELDEEEEVCRVRFPVIIPIKFAAFGAATHFEWLTTRAFECSLLRF